MRGSLEFSVSFEQSSSDINGFDTVYRDRDKRSVLCEPYDTFISETLCPSVRFEQETPNINVYRRCKLNPENRANACPNLDLQVHQTCGCLHELYCCTEMDSESDLCTTKGWRLPSTMFIFSCSKGRLHVFNHIDYITQHFDVVHKMVI